MQSWVHREELAEMAPRRAMHVDEGAFPTRRELLQKGKTSQEGGPVGTAGGDTYLCPSTAQGRGFAGVCSGPGCS